MHNIYADDAASRYLRMIRTNTLPIGDYVREVGIFLKIVSGQVKHSVANLERRGSLKSAQRMRGRIVNRANLLIRHARQKNMKCNCNRFIRGPRFNRSLLLVGFLPSSPYTST